jgi:hypothetical protein
VGLFQLRNATVEGVALLEDGRLLAAAERSDRGLIEIPASRDLRGALAWSMPRSQFVLGGTRLPDFSDLAVSGNEVFALIRNGHLIVRMRRTSTSWLEAQAWSFAHSENASGHAYFDRRYGVAEGLAFDENFIYVVLDNNQDGRLVKPADVRPQLMVFNRPQSFAKR